MPVLHWWFVTASGWFWHYATHIHLGDLGGSWLGAVVLFLLWTGDAMLFLGYAVLTLFVICLLLAGAGAFLKAVGSGFREGYRKSSAR